MNGRHIINAINCGGCAARCGRAGCVCVSAADKNKHTLTTAGHKQAPAMALLTSSLPTEVQLHESAGLTPTSANTWLIDSTHVCACVRANSLEDTDFCKMLTRSSYPMSDRPCQQQCRPVEACVMQISHNRTTHTNCVGI